MEYNCFEDLSFERFKIVCLFEASCPVCIEEIYKIDNYIHSKNGMRINAQFIVILTGFDSEFTRYHLKEINSFEFPIMYDPEDKFVKKNKLGILKFSNCILVSPDNIIKACGIPYLNTSVEKEYKKLIKNK